MQNGYCHEQIKRLISYLKWYNECIKFNNDLEISYDGYENNI